eukprot:TRINITY_DN11958_c3_g1_i1.p2 TRINITY_DN11958_c3_g1~~TRINITY_DN11958_c3_g1_i1.p2  ORF type:complete len:137 (+),score=13.56 TRINITY_DN11958_c3_g1_i1:2968-3378(+)
MPTTSPTPSHSVQSPPSTPATSPSTISTPIPNPVPPAPPLFTTPTIPSTSQLLLMPTNAHSMVTRSKSGIFIKKRPIYPLNTLLFFVTMTTTIRLHPLVSQKPPNLLSVAKLWLRNSLRYNVKAPDLLSLFLLTNM